MRKIEKDLSKLEQEINYSFKNKDLLIMAITHTSYAYENKTKSYERLEFLGDSILEFISSKYLFENYNNLSEGEMTKVRAYSVCEDSLYKVAIQHNFSDFLYLGKSELASNSNRKAILADTVEAIIAAIYLDSGDIEVVTRFVIDNIKDQIEYASHNVGLKDYKTYLQEILQVNGEVSIKYTIIKEEGPDHDKTFTAEVECDGNKLAIGSGRSKKAAEMEAARKAISIIEKKE